MRHFNSILQKFDQIWHDFMNVVTWMHQIYVYASLYLAWIYFFGRVGRELASWLTCALCRMALTCPFTDENKIFDGKYVRTLVMNSFTVFKKCIFTILNHSVVNIYYATKRYIDTRKVDTHIIYKYHKLWNGISKNLTHFKTSIL